MPTRARGVCDLSSQGDLSGTTPGDEGGNGGFACIVDHRQYCAAARFRPADFLIEFLFVRS
jgi:hypothetical protein